MALLSYRYTSVYENLVTALQDASASANCGDIKIGKPVLKCFRSLDGDQGCFECYLHLKGWRYRGASTKRISILLHAQEEIRCTDLQLVRSTVRVSYFKIENDKAALLQSTHFDYGPSQDSHPIFHAQVTNKPVRLPDAEIEELDFGFAIEPSDTEWFQQSRIPTSDMTFSSVVLCLAADHFETAFFNDFLDKVCKIQNKMPHPSFEKLKYSFQNESAHFRSSHWFAHMRTEPPS